MGWTTPCSCIFASTSGGGDMSIPFSASTSATSAVIAIVLLPSAAPAAQTAADALAAGDAPHAPLLLEQLAAKAVQRRRAVAFQGLEDRLVVGDRQRRFDRDAALDRVADPGRRRGLAPRVEELREKPGDGCVEPDACDAHARDAIAGPPLRGAPVWTVGQVPSE